MFPSPTLPIRYLYLTLLLFLLLSIFIASLPVVSPAAFSTISVSRIFNQTLVCALLPSPCKTRYDFNCTAFPSGRTRTYPSGSAIYSAIAAGDGFLCALASLPSSNNTLFAMRWWDLTKPPHRSSTNPSSVVFDFKRVYQGPALQALSAGDSHVCGILGDIGELNCWRWPQLDLPPRLANVSSFAVGGDFICVLFDHRNVKCFSVRNSTAGVLGNEPAGNFSIVSAGSHHACVVSLEGELVCWGVGAPVLPKNTMEITSLASGDNRTCALFVSGTMDCWGDDIFVPENLVGAHFLAIEAKGKAFCGILVENFTMVCWGSKVFDGGNSTVFQRVLPGTCTAESSCSCGIIPDSGSICLSGAICAPCKIQLTPVAPPPSSRYSPPHSSLPVPGQLNRPNSSRSSKVLFVVLGAVGFSVGLAVVLFFLSLRLMKKSGRIHDSPAAAAAVTELPAGSPAAPAPLMSKTQSSFLEEFPMKVLLSATDEFSDEHKIGSGSFGTVYKANIPDGREVAIKRAELPAPLQSSTSTSNHAQKRRRDKESAFLSELALLSRVNHKNLVRLLGYCREGQERILVYEFMPNGSLHDHLHKLQNSPLSSWKSRLRAAIDAARGVEYLHAYAVPPIIHRDIKSSNILLDANMTAKVSDFGLSLMNPEASEEISDRAAGTVGYMDPEYYRLHHLTTKSDVYSFGVVLLELLTGSRVIQKYDESGTPRNVVEFAIPEIEADELHRVLDTRLPPPTPSEIEAVALVSYLAADCVTPAGRDRPDMTDVVATLERALAACEHNAPPPFPPAPPPLLRRSATTRSL